MANSVVRNIIKRINDSGFFTVIADESTDVSGKQQLSICLRYVTMKFKVVENFVGLYAVGKADAAHLTAVLLDCFTRLNLDVHMLRGQGYDGAAVMSGARTGIAVQIAEKEARAVYLHCAGHTLHVALQDAVRQILLIRDAMDLTHRAGEFF